MKFRILSLVLVLCLVMAGCGTAKEAEPTTEPVAESVTEPATEPATEPESVRETLPSVENGPISMEELLGDWCLDGDYTKEKTGMSLEDFYGAAWEDEDILHFDEDGSMLYKAGICYGNGVYGIAEDGIRVEYAGDEDEDDAGFNLLLVDRGDKLRIAMDQYGDGNYVYWVKE